MTAMLKELDLPSLESRRKENRLCQLYKISNDLVPAIPKGDYLTKQRIKRKTKATMDAAFVRENFVENYQNLHDNCYIVPETNTPIYRVATTRVLVQSVVAMGYLCWNRPSPLVSLAAE